MNRQQLIHQILTKRSYLCVGLDSDVDKLPSGLSKDAAGVLAFNKAIVDATRSSCVAYKINTAFYESLGAMGWSVMEQTVAYIGKEHLVIADAKRGDIGNTADQYAKAFFKTLSFDAITVAPYMGADSIRPFLEYSGKWAIVLGLTSNPGAADFELQPCGDQLLYERVMQTVSSCGSPSNLMFVVGATQAAVMASIRKNYPDHFFLVPGVGAQGGSLEEVSRHALTSEAGLLVNVSRAIIFASAGDDFAEKASAEALRYQQQMAALLPRGV
ncbi:MAG: orotidine-5'-phosphate decarboxylase [Sphingomonadales bacterium]|nr:orotidine-5'-phosphate decarboxylase [Sphingomonadales bacterium]